MAGTLADSKIVVLAASRRTFRLVAPDFIAPLGVACDRGALPNSCEQLQIETVQSLIRLTEQTNL